MRVTQAALRSIRRNLGGPLIIVAMALLGLTTFFAIFAPLIAPYEHTRFRRFS